jgi:NAD(P)H dehydrogenase (quinone)
LLTHKKALIISTTIFDKASYDQGLRAAMKTLVDDFALHYPGIKTVEHEYFYAVHGADLATRQAWLERAHVLAACRT